MRTAGLLLTLSCLGGLACAGCKNKGDADAAPDPAALKAQQELVARRDALMTERKKLESERDKLDAEIQDVQAKGGDTAELVKQREQIVTRIESQTTDLSSMSSKIDAFEKSGDVTSREAAVALREKSVAAREAALAEREHEFVKLTAQSAKQWKEQCTTTAAPSTIIQVAPPKGGTYARADVDRMYKRARTLLLRKGLLPSDLGAGASLERDAQAAISKQDWVAAYVAAAQLYKYAESIKIDRAFILAKHARLNAVVKRSDALQQQLDAGLVQVMKAYTNGKHAVANAKLNELWSLVR